MILLMVLLSQNLPTAKMISKTKMVMLKLPVHQLPARDLQSTLLWWSHRSLQQLPTPSQLGHVYVYFNPRIPEYPVQIHDIRAKGRVTNHVTQNEHYRLLNSSAAAIITS